MGKCTAPPDGVAASIFGVEVDPCVYEEIERHANVTVIVQRCRECGEVVVRWMRQPNTVDLEAYEEYEGDGEI